MDRVSIGELTNARIVLASLLAANLCARRIDADVIITDRWPTATDGTR